MDKLKMHSPNLVEQNVEKIADLFPNCISEAAGEQGELKKAIDFDLLKQELSRHIVEGPQERYQLNWPGKREALLTANAPVAKTLRPCREESVDFDTTENLFIEGDNLDALKLLQETYLGKIKMIYIDPPYNTGKDFIYEDDFAENIDSYIRRSNQKDEDGKRLLVNTESNGRFHSDWLSMMYPRLKLAKNLLSEDGIIFISIDDGEQENLKKIGCEIYGESNFLAHICWQKKYAVSNDDPGIGVMHDHILVFRKSGAFQRNLLARTKKQNDRYKNIDNDARGNWASDNYVSNKSKTERPTLWYSITHPKTGDEVWPDESAVWRYSKEKHLQLEVEGRLYWGPDQSYTKPRMKRFLSEIQDGIVPNTWWTFEEVGHNDEAQKETAKLIGKKIFSTPKPVRLLKRIIDISTDCGDIILDFFAGSGSTAHAVMEAAVDKGPRKFISVQAKEVCSEKSEAYQAGFKNIADISKQRIRLAGQKIVAENIEKKHIKNLDIGFRVLKIDSSNMSDVHYNPNSVSQTDLFTHIENVKEDRTEEDLLFQVMLDWGVDLTLPIRREIIDNNTVFFVADNALVACFDNSGKITEGFVRRLADFSPLRLVFRDGGFASDSAKINVEQVLKQLSPLTDVKSI
jgi:adenine-specific DNA-methyltransferase